MDYPKSVYANWSLGMGFLAWCLPWVPVLAVIAALATIPLAVMGWDSPKRARGVCGVVLGIACLVLIGFIEGVR